MRRHKNDCLCAICVLKRRRKEREEKERMAKGQTGVGDELKQEVTPNAFFPGKACCIMI